MIGIIYNLMAMFYEQIRTREKKIRIVGGGEKVNLNFGRLFRIK